MTLAAGTRLGPYEIQAVLGAGGMGEVYRARDTRLERTVAIKVLAASLNARPETRKRFEREARALSGLSHPHICTLYDIGCQDGVDYLVMEYLEGETLEQRLNKGPLPDDQVLKYGIEIADALEKAHRQNVVHRDLKPGNIMLTKAGAKLLDFGLARLITQPVPLGEAPSELTAQTRDSLTEEGVVLGTFQYMAPEQLEGKEADARADIFALGEVIYEMATGRPAFSGQSRASLIAAILTAEPAPISSLRPLTPPALDAVVRTCLAKDPADRWQSAHDVKLNLNWIVQGTSQVGLPITVINKRKLRERTSWAVAGLCALTAGLLGVGYVGRAPKPQKPVMFNVEAPLGYKVEPNYWWSLMAPDGESLIFAVRDDKGELAVAHRSLSSNQSRVLPLPIADGYAWGPDSKTVYYATGKKIWRMGVDTGSPEVVCEVPKYLPVNAVNGKGEMLLGEESNSIVFLEPGNCSQRKVADAATLHYDRGFNQATFLPDGKHFLFTGVRNSRRDDILQGSVDGPTAQVLIQNGAAPKFVRPGYLLFGRQGALLAQTFDPASGKLSGTPFRALPRTLNFASGVGFHFYDASLSGTLAYVEQNIPRCQLQWFEASGKAMEKIGQPRLTFGIRIRLNATGGRILASTFDTDTHTGTLAVADAETGAFHEISSLQKPGDIGSAWSPDSKKVAYSAVGAKGNEIRIKPADDPGDGEVLISLPDRVDVADWTPDGKTLIVTMSNPALSSWSISRISVDGSHTPVPVLIRSDTVLLHGLVSPDGRLLAYAESDSWAGNPLKLYVRSMDDRGSGKLVPGANGSDFAWGRGPNQLIFNTAEHKLISVMVTARSDGEISVSEPKMMFELKTDFSFDVDRRSGRLLLSLPLGLAGLEDPITILTNWLSTIKPDEAAR